MKAKSIKGKSTEEIKATVEQSMADGFTPTLAIIFISIKQDRKAVFEILHEKGIDVVGATSSTEFIAGYQEEGSAVILLLDIKKEYYSILFQEVGSMSVSDAGAKMANSAMQHFKNPAFILFSSGLSVAGKMMDGESLIHTIERVVGPQANMFGGMAGDDMTFTGTYAFTYDQSTDYGLAALVLNEDKISLHGMAVSGWKPIGVTRTVTKSEGNHIYTIDNQPALDLYLRYLGSVLPSADNEHQFFENLGNQYPIQIERADREALMCNPIGFDREKNALVCEIEVKEGSRFRFSTPPDFDIVDTIIREASEVKKQVQTNADALLIFSCAGRLAALGPMAQQENEGLAEVWNSPMAGFYSYGEFGRSVNGKHEFHSTTNSWVAIKEK